MQSPVSGGGVRALLAIAAEAPNGARWSVAFVLGLRQGEALGLLWEDVDLDAGTLTVRRALQRVKGKGLVLVEPKSFAGRRALALLPPLLEALRRHRARQFQQRMAASDVWQAGGDAFARADGKPIWARTDWQAWKRLLKTAGVRNARLRDARRTAATLLLQQGVAARGGHAAARPLAGRDDDARHARRARAGPGRGRPMGQALWAEAK